MGDIVLTNQRFIYESGNLGKNKTIEFEVPINMITGYRHAYNVSGGQLLPMKDCFSIFISDGKSYKFFLKKRDELFDQFKKLMPSAQQLPDEKYGEAVAGIGTKIVGNVKSAVSGAQGKSVDYVPNSTSNPTTQTTVTEMINCPECDTPNSKTSKFCNSCGDKLQLECPNCHATIEDDKKFCGECGTPIKRKDECPSCGAKIVKDQKFCNECGEKI